jgi:CBS domain-containing protein
MTRDPVSVAPELTLANAVRILQERRVGCLPVVSEGKLIGLLTETDLLRVLGQMLDAQER